MDSSRGEGQRNLECYQPPGRQWFAAVNGGLGRSALMILGLLLALVSALATNVAFLLKHRGAVLAPPIRVQNPLGSTASLFRSRWFAIGWMVAVGT